MHLTNMILWLVNIYGPNRDTPNFYWSISDHLSAFNGEFIIMAGDFNLVQEPVLDYFNYNNVNNPEARKALLSLKKITWSGRSLENQI